MLGTRSWVVIVLLAVTCICAHTAHAQMRITEWMYNGLLTGSAGEFVEFTNMGSSPVNMNNWSFDDNSRAPGSQNLSAFGLVQPGESVIFTDDTAANFRTRWALPAFIKIIGGNGNNLGRADEINLYDVLTGDATTVPIDRLTYDDQTLGGPRTQNVAGGPNSDAVLGTNVHAQWTLESTSSFAGDPHHVGAVTSTSGEIGTPGYYLVPEPASLGLICAAGLLFIQRRRA